MPPLSPRGRRLLWVAIGIGTAARLVVAFATEGLPYDLDSYGRVNAGLREGILEVYSNTIDEQGYIRWPYPPGLFPWVYASGWIAAHTALPFHGVIQLPSIAADAALALLVQYVLGRRGYSERMRLAGAGLVALGPSFAAVSGYHGHFDSLAILPAVAALAVWDHSGSPRRALVAGALIGLGGMLKTVPLVLALALLPSSRSRREGVTLLATAGAVALLPLVPFAVADLSGVRESLRYGGLPGAGGLSLLAQPNLAEGWLNGVAVDFNAATDTLFDHGSLTTGAILLLVTGFLLRHRAEAVPAAVVLWLAVYVFGSGFFVQYLVWGLPFFLLAGHIRKVALLQAVLIVPTVIWYGRPWAVDLVPIYVPLMLALWAAFAVAFVMTVARIARPRSSISREGAPPSTPARRRRAPAG